jgi:hypothetical protein
MRRINTMGIVILLYIGGLAVIVYMLILLAEFLKSGKKAFDVYVENNNKNIDYK